MSAVYWAPLSATAPASVTLKRPIGDEPVIPVYTLESVAIEFDVNLNADEAAFWAWLLPYRPVERARRLAVQRAMRARNRRAARKGRRLR